jgi:uncharacterized protein YndB with AHSA1/START domain
MATRPKVGVTTFTTPSDRELVAPLVVDAPRTLVWEAWTRPEHLPHWMLGAEGWTMPVCEIDRRPGGAWHFGWRQPDGSDGDARRVPGAHGARAAAHHRVVGRRLGLRRSEKERRTQISASLA